jgi:hypothetical protein
MLHSTFFSMDSSRETVIRRYLKYPKIVEHIYSTLSDFFLGTWSKGRKKPFT